MVTEMVYRGSRPGQQQHSRPEAGYLDLHVGTAIVTYTLSVLPFPANYHRQKDCERAALIAAFQFT
jgi:hypothetical protein